MALELVTAGELSGDEALVAVVWPQSERLHAAPYVAEWPAELRGEAVELYAAGWSLRALSRRLGVSYGTAKSWILAFDVRRNGAVVQRPAYNSVP